VASVRARERGESVDQPRSTFNHTVSDADGDHVPVQVEETMTFLSRHLDSLVALRKCPGVECATLDFGWSMPSSKSGQWNTFPASLLALCGEADIDLVVSVYLTESEGVDL
jgi:hypothetical protein